MNLENYISSTTYFTNYGDPEVLNKEMDFHFDAVLRVPNFSGVIIIHIYCGGDLGNQLIHLTNAVKQFNAINEDYKLAVEILNNIQFTKFYFEKQWGIKDLVNWLLASHIHFVTCHPHQGLFINGVDISPTEIYKELHRLRYHPGFPNGDFLNCPIFQQDKASYLKLLNFDSKCNPTILIHTDCNLSAIEKDIEK